MNYFDIIVGLILIFFAIRGFFKGFLIGVASFAGLLAGLYVAIHFSNYMGNILSHGLKLSEQTINILSFLITFALVIFLVHILARFLEKVISTVGLSFLNKLGGLALGLGKGLLFVSVFFYLFILLGGLKIIDYEVKEKSFFFKPVSKLTDLIAGEVKDQLEGSKKPQYTPENEGNVIKIKWSTSSILQISTLYEFH
ncbi:MAG TPA: CvpA family protein [Bacteroidales bacterium]|nr:CvpA family protein [Bacteroidales bacterium]